MHAVHRALIAVACTVAVATTAPAQTCLGRPYYSTGPLQLGLNGKTGNHASSIGVEFAAGRHRSVFGVAGVAQESGGGPGITTNNDPDGMVVSGVVGHQMTFGTKGRSQFCPVVAGEAGNLEFTSNAEMKKSQLEVGGRIGTVLPRNSGMHLVPFAGVSVARLDRDLRFANGTRTSMGTDTYVPVSIGMGFHWENSVMLVSQLTVPVNLSGGDPSLGIQMVVPVGRKK